MIRLIGVELLKLRKRVMTLVLSILVAALVPGMLLLLLAAVEAMKAVPAAAGGIPPEQLDQLTNSLVLPAAIPNILSQATFILALALVVLAAGAVGGEYGWGTVRTMVVNSPGRIRFLLAKAIAIGVIGIIWIVGALALGILTTLVITSLLGKPVTLSFLTASYLGELLLMLARTALSIIPYMLLAFWLAVLGRSSLLGIAGGLGYYFVEVISVDLMRQAGGWMETAANWSIGTSARSLIALNGASGSVGINTGVQTPPHYLDWGWSTGILLAYCTFFLVFSLLIFQRRDISSAH